MRTPHWFRNVITVSMFAAMATVMAQPTQADPGNKEVVEFCKGAAQNPNAAPNCFGQCMGLNGCFDKSGQFTPTFQCIEKRNIAQKACGGI